MCPKFKRHENISPFRSFFYLAETKTFFRSKKPFSRRSRISSPNFLKMWTLTPPSYPKGGSQARISIKWNWKPPSRPKGGKNRISIKWKWNPSPSRKAEVKNVNVNPPATRRTAVKPEFPKMRVRTLPPAARRVGVKFRISMNRDHSPLAARRAALKL